MDADDDAYAVLGLEPGAGAGDIERAYRDLIKRHHPDRRGGDPAQASAINRAYQRLRETFLRRDIALRPPQTIKPPGWSRTIWAAALIVLLGVAAATLSLFAPSASSGPASGQRAASGGSPTIDPMERAIDASAVDGGALKALELIRSSDEMALSAWSQTCFEGLRADPRTSQFDRCAAFDAAAVRLLDRDPLRDRGPFSEIAVTGRLWSAAADLSGNYLATDVRMQRIRLRVELLLAQRGAIGA